MQAYTYTAIDESTSVVALNLRQVSLLLSNIGVNISSIPEVRWFELILPND